MKDSIIKIPTTIKAGAVAADGTIPIIGAINSDSINNTATVTDVNPVLPPCPIPAALSTYVVVLLVPKSAPIDVAVASANNALSNFDEKLFSLSNSFSSLSSNIPAFLPVPKNVPIVSKVSDKENANIVINTKDILDGSLNNPAKSNLKNVGAILGIPKLI